MFVLSRDVSVAKRVIATLLAIALAMWAFGLQSSYAEAANITTVSDLMTDTSPTADSSHTITFTIPTSLLVAETIVINFDSTQGFDFTGVTTGDFSETVNGTATTTFTEAVNTGTDTITLTRTGSTLATSSVIAVLINGTNKINNPDPADGNESYEIDITAGTDSGHTRVVILDTVLVTAQVNTSFDFTVTGLATSTQVNGTSTTGTAGSTTIPFGNLTAYVGKTLGQRLNVTTNAKNGFAVTVKSDGQLDSSTGADIDNFKDDVVGAPAAWESPSVGLNISDEKTWGHWGITSSDSSLQAGDTYGTSLWKGVSTTPTQIFYHTGPADGTTVDIGSTTVAYKVQISPLQEAGDDYSAILTYIATPVF